MEAYWIRVYLRSSFVPRIKQKKHNVTASSFPVVPNCVLCRVDLVDLKFLDNVISQICTTEAKKGISKAFRVHELLTLQIKAGKDFFGSMNAELIELGRIYGVYQIDLSTLGSLLLSNVEQKFNPTNF